MQAKMTYKSSSNSIKDVQYHEGKSITKCKRKRKDKKQNNHIGVLPQSVFETCNKPPLGIYNYIINEINNFITHISIQLITKDHNY